MFSPLNCELHERQGHVCFYSAMIIKHGTLWLLNIFMLMNEWIHSKLLDILRIVQYNQYSLVESKVNMCFRNRNNCVQMMSLQFDTCLIYRVGILPDGTILRIKWVNFVIVLQPHLANSRSCETSNLLIDSFKKHLLNIHGIHKRLCAMGYKVKLFPDFTSFSDPNCNATIVAERLKEMHVSHLEIM